MNIEDIKMLLVNSLSNLENRKRQAVEIGDILSLVNIEDKMLETKNTIDKLKPIII